MRTRRQNIAIEIRKIQDNKCMPSLKLGMIKLKTAEKDWKEHMTGNEEKEMARLKKNEVVANNYSYKLRSIDKIKRQSVFPLFLLMTLAVLFVYAGIGRLIEKEYPFGIGLICISIIQAVIFSILYKRIMINNKLYKGLSTYKKNKREYLHCKTVSSFITNYDKAIEAVIDIASTEPECLLDGMLAEGRLIELKNEFQRSLKHVIDREKNDVLYDLNYKFKHSLKHKEALYNDFWQDMNLNKERFSDETKIYADQAIESVYKASGSTEKVHHPLSGWEPDQAATSSIMIELDKKEFEKDFEKWSEERNRRLSRYMTLESAIESMVTDPKTMNKAIEETDSMSGLDFEKWCANILKNNSFVNVRVTPGSNDQGVDILAEKDGIKYAIQCKCYTTDLSNTPVQEVSAGKKFYDCHVGVVMTNSHFTKGAVALAKKTGVLLWDREVVAGMVSNE